MYMELMISRILKYLNGCLDDDHMYRIGNFVIQHYTEMEKYDLDGFLSASNFSESELLDFCRHFGIHSYDEFKGRLLADHQSRLEQIHARMLNLDCNQFIEHLDTSYGILTQFYNVYKFLTYLNITCIILSLVHCLFKFKTNFFNIRINKIVFYIGFIIGFLPIILYLIPIINTIINY